MFKFQQYRVKAAEYGELVKSSADADESRKYQDLEDRFVALANNERGLAEAYHDSVHMDELDRTRGEVLAAEEEQVLRCLGAAVIMSPASYPYEFGVMASYLYSVPIQDNGRVRPRD